MSVEELGGYSALLTKYLTLADRVQSWAKYFIAADRAEREDDVLRRISYETAK